MTETRDVIIHYHIFKNAGSTLATTLERNFGTRFVNFDSEDYNRRLWPHELVGFLQANAHVVAVSSHHLRPPAQPMPGTAIHEVLVLRNPIDRIRSMYDFYHRAMVNEDPLTVEAKRLSLPVFLEYVIEKWPNLIANAQVKLLANGGAKIPDREDAASAARLLGSLALVGVVEEFDICAVAGEHSLAKIFPALDLSYVRENVTQRRARRLDKRLRQFSAACGEALYRKLVSVNELDQELVTLTAAESRRRLQAIPSPEGHLRDFRKRVFRREVAYRLERGRERVTRAWSKAAGVILSPRPTKAGSELR